MVLLLLLLRLEPALALDPPHEDLDEPAHEGGSDDHEEGIDPRTPQDLRTETYLRRIFAQIEGLSRVSVEVSAGVARLTGSVQRIDDREAAKAIAAKPSWIVWVDDQLEMDLPEEPPVPAPDIALQKRLSGLFAEVEALREIQVEVRNGVVRLRGEVPSLDDQKAAIALAERTQGVIFVDDALMVATSVEKRVAPAVKALQTRARDLYSRLPLFGIGLILLVLFWYGSRWISSLIFTRRWTKERPLMIGLFQGSTRVGIFLLGLVLVLDLLDLTTIVGAMLGTAGILGVALGFAFRDIVENYLASIILTVRQPFARGDTIEVAGQTGRVLRLTLRETVLVTADGNHLRVPNATVFKSVMQNFSTNPLRRFRFTVSVAADQPLDAVLTIIRDTLRGVEGVLDDPAASVSVDALTDSGVTLSVAAWVNQRETAFGAVRTRAIKRVKAALDAGGIHRPESQVRVYAGERDRYARTAPPPSSTEPIDILEDKEEPFLTDREDEHESNLLR
ncbi:MAG: BON domain-containing protein [Deltaproteobacteria bacterium]|nr:MAG: BON domain-containing protein [Deltaproteobacteria bacterium]